MQQKLNLNSDFPAFPFAVRALEPQDAWCRYHQPKTRNPWANEFAFPHVEVLRVWIGEPRAGETNPIRAQMRNGHIYLRSDQSEGAWMFFVDSRATQADIDAACKHAKGRWR